LPIVAISFNVCDVDDEDNVDDVEGEGNVDGVDDNAPVEASNWCQFRAAVITPVRAIAVLSIF